METAAGEDERRRKRRPRRRRAKPEAIAARLKSGGESGRFRPRMAAGDEGDAEA